MLTNVNIQPYEGRETDLLPLLEMAHLSAPQLRQWLKQAQLYAVTNAQQEVMAAYALHPLDLRTMEVKAMAVRPADRRRGIAKQILEHAAVQARIQGYDQLQIGAPNSNPLLMAFFQRAGFDLSGVRKNVLNRSQGDDLLEDGIPVRHLLLFVKKVG